MNWTWRRSVVSLQQSCTHSVFWKLHKLSRLELCFFFHNNKLKILKLCGLLTLCTKMVYFNLISIFLSLSVVKFLTCMSYIFTFYKKIEYVHVSKQNRKCFFSSTKFLGAVWIMKLTAMVFGNGIENSIQKCIRTTNPFPLTGL